MSDRPPAAVPDAEQRYVALAVRSRRQLLDVLRAASGPICAGELAAAVGLHVTTARAHLRVLEAAGLVARTSRPAIGPGRPRQFYVPTADHDAGDGHRELAEVLAGALGAGGEEGRRRAEDAGRRWAEREVPAAAHRSWEQAVDGITELFRRVGFAPRRVGVDGGGYRIALERCPFRDVARAHPEVVCTVHLGLMRGALARFGQPGVAESAQLQPFLAPELCMAGVPAPPVGRHRG
jgi:predicted ArsR family transcriptional regulator